LKITANNGYKPKNFIIPPKISSRGYYRNQYQGKFKITAYAPCKEECGNNLGITSSGTPIVAGYSVAVDNKYWPMGTTFYIKGIGYVAAMDTGGMIKGRNRMDLAIFDKESVNNFGIRYMDVYLVKLGNGKVKIP
jgi:3D (Asp-Asp-Asp) domain-containing protein